MSMYVNEKESIRSTLNESTPFYLSPEVYVQL